MKIRIGTRRSPLALWQARHVGELLRRHDASLQIELVEISTQGDRILDTPLARIGGKGLFVKEIEERLLSGSVDLAVHSLKDMPALLPEGLVIAAVPEREDPRDALVSAKYRKLADLPPGARVGTSSLRRAFQLLAWRGDLQVVPIRGNVQSRLRRIDEDLDAGVLATAGLIRLGLAGRIAEVLEPAQMLPAVGQGALAIEARHGDSEIGARLSALEHAPTRLAVSCERALLGRLGGGCQVPIAAYARLDGRQIALSARVGLPDGTRSVSFSGSGGFSSLAEVEAFGVSAADELLARGAREILDSVLAAPGIPES